MPQAQSQVNRQLPFILAVLLLPLTLLYRAFAKPLGLFWYLFPFLHRLFPAAASSTRSGPGLSRGATGRRALSPRDTAARFIREFEEEYGPNSLPFYEDGYAQALDAAKKDLRFLLVLLVSREHDDTAPFVRQTLLAKEVADYVSDARNNIILWAGSVQDAEAYQVAAALDCSKFPFAALIAHTPHVSAAAMSVVARVVGPTPPAAFVARLRDAAAQHSATLEQARAARASREAERSLREQQDSAYQRSLAQDRERARQRREEEASRARAEQEARRRLEAKQQREQRRTQWRQWRAQQLSAEPPTGAKNATRVSIRMLSGERVVRRFASDADIDELYAYVECCDLLRAGPENSGPAAVERPEGYEHSYGFRLVSPMPRTVYDPHTGVCIGQQIMGNSNLVVEPLDEDDESESSADED